MNLSTQTIKEIAPGKVVAPKESLLQLPEKVLQFGTGVLLRGLPDYFIDKANRKGIFNGRIVVVKSTTKGDLSFFAKQNGLYTLCIRGLEKGKKIEENIINSSISRVLNAGSEWREILGCAHNKDLQIIISNTTEVGLTLLKEDVSTNPPSSFPGKLLAILSERFKAFNGSNDSGCVIIPTELIPDNGKKLQAIILELAKFNKFGDAFIDWFERCNYFCNSLVDRIVTGMPAVEIKNEIENEIGYRDDLLTVCEVYRLWAIEGDSNIKKILSFAEADEGMIIAPDITLYRELKLRLLNATHTLSCGVAFFAGIDTVKDAMNDEVMTSYITTLMQQEVAHSIPYEIDDTTIHAYTENVLDRFRNPYINHYWKSITLNYSSKIRLRCVPVLLTHYKNNDTVPELLALGFAAYIRFMKAVNKKGNEYFGEFNSQHYLIEDEKAEALFNMWQNLPQHKIVNEVLKSIELWGADLTILPGFQEAVSENLNGIISTGMRYTLENIDVIKLNLHAS